MGTEMASDLHRDDSDDYEVVDARRVILDLPEGLAVTDLLPGREVLPGGARSAGGHASWLRGPRVPDPANSRPSST
jgi:hypothetical protein